MWWITAASKFCGHSVAPMTENGQPACMFPYSLCAMVAKLKNATITIDTRTSETATLLIEWPIRVYYNVFALSRSELPKTEPLENAIAGPANTGESSQPKK